MDRRIFVTGTDTGVGKTVVTGLLLAYLLSRKANVVGLKPFCSGERTDAEVVYELQGQAVALDIINPFYFRTPVTPTRAAMLEGKTIQKADALAAIRSVQADYLIVEGAGGLLSPLGQNFSAADLITDLEAEVIVVALNRLGVLNHTLLTLECLRLRGVKAVKVALVDGDGMDDSHSFNREDLAAAAGDVPIISIPRFENFKMTTEEFRKGADTVGEVLENLLR